MKKMSIVIAVPLIGVAAVVAIVFAVKLNSQTTNADTKAYEKRVYPGLNTGSGKPGTGYGTMGAVQGGTGAGGAVSSSTKTADLSRELQATQDDGGASDIQSIKTLENNL